ncbi:MAG: hypothetical protein NUW23_00060 [Firmicutes bacterium]|jgi:hypothetical protein|nr:hypothetical protein [Bacillota bacterium]
MWRTHLVYLVLAVLLGLTIAPPSTEAAPGAREYINRQYGFGFRYPDGWERQQQSYPGPKPVVVLGEPTPGGFGPSVNAIADNRAASARVYAQDAADRIARGMVPGLSDFLPDGAGSPVSIPGADGWVMRFSCYASNAGARLWFYQLTVARGSSIIVLTATCPESQKARYSPVFRDIIASFRLTQ